jgi:hypothetical protein
VSKASSTGEKPGRTASPAWTAAVERSRAASPPVGGGDGAGEKSTTETSSGFDPPMASHQGEPSHKPQMSIRETFKARRARSEQSSAYCSPNSPRCQGISANRSVFRVFFPLGKRISRRRAHLGRFPTPADHLFCACSTSSRDCQGRHQPSSSSSMRSRASSSFSGDS